MNSKIIKVLVLFLILICNSFLLISYPVADYEFTEEWIIDGNTVYVNDSLVFASATPHTVHGTDEVIFEFESKEFTGNIDFCWGFNQQLMIPTDIWLWENYSHENYYYEEQEFYDCVDLYNVTDYNDLGIENYSNYSVFLGNENNSYLYNVTLDENQSRIYAFSEFTDHGSGHWRLCGNYNDSVKIWDNQTFFDWKPWEVNYEHISWNYQNMTDWYITPSQPIVQDVLYKCKIRVERIDWSLDTVSGKYWFAFKPSSETLSESVSNGHFYCLDPWYDSSWEYKKEITLNSSQVPSTLSNFPVCINITDTDLRDNAQSDGDDIVFTNGDEDTQLNHEIEYWNDTTGKLVAWVNVTSLSSTSDTSIYMYYGNDACANQENVADTWNDDYLSVWHFHSVTGDQIDSTGNNDLTNSGTTYGAEGKIGYCIDAPSSNDWLYSNSYTYNVDGEVSITTWANVSGGSYSARIVEIDHNEFNSHCICLDEEHSNRVRGWTIDDDGSTRLSEISYGSGYNDEEWHQFSFTYASGNGGLFVDGDRKTSSGDVSSGLYDVDEVGIAAAPDNGGSGNYVNAKIDEVRVSKIRLSDDWINTEYNSITNATDGGFFSVGSEEMENLPIASNPSPSDDATGVFYADGVELNITVTEDAGESYDVEFYDNATDTQIGSTQTEIQNTSCSVTWTGLSENTEYEWYVNMTQSNVPMGDTPRTNTSEIYSFTTYDNQDPSVSNFIPSDGTIRVSMNATLSVDVSDAEGDNITVNFYNNSDDSLIGSDSRDSNGTVSVSWNNLSQDTEYSWYVKAYNDDIRGADNTTSAVQSFTVVDINPPSSFSVSATSHDNITVSWTDGENATRSYIIYKTGSYPSNRSDGTSVGSLVSPHTITGLDGDTTYYFKAWGYNSSETAYSPDNVTTSSTITYPEKPLSVTATPDSESKIDLTWSKGDGADKTLIRYSDSSYPSSPTDGTLLYNNTGTSTSATGLSSLTTYYFTLWSWGTTKNDFSILNVTVNSTTVSTPIHPSSFSVEMVDESTISLSWSMDATSDKTKVVRKVDSYPSTIADGTVVYFDTSESYVDTGLDTSTDYYYRAWGFRSDYSVYSDSYANASNWTRPEEPQNITTVSPATDTVNISWNTSIGADTYVIRKKASDYPSSPTDDGTLLQHSSALYYNDTSFSSEFYTVWSYNSSSGFYSDDALVYLGSLSINAYKESNPSIGLTDFSIEIVNLDGTESYVADGCSNPTNINVDNVPHGTDIAIKISQDGYYSRIKYFSIDANSNYIINFYLPANPEGGGTSGNDDYVTPEDEEESVISSSNSVSNPAVNLSIILDCEPSLIVSVQGYNESLYGHFFTIPDDKYDVSSNVIEIDNSVLDENTSLVQVNYYCDIDESYANQYLINVIDETGYPVTNALINVSFYVNTTEEYSTLYQVYSDSSGEVDLYLISGTLYKFEITKEGYQVGLSDYIPSESKYTKEFTLLYEETDPETSYTPNEHVTLTGELSGTDLYVNFSCDWGVISNSQLYVYETNVSTGNETSFYNNSFLVDNEWAEIIGSADSNCSYRVVVHYNHTYWDHQKMTIIINPTYTPPTTETDTDNMFDANYGTNPFGWSNFFLWVFMILLFLYADKEGAGLILIVIGGINLLVSSLLGFNTTIAVVAGGIVPVLFIIVGIMLLWKQYRSVNA